VIRVELPPHLQTLARVGREVEVSVEGPVTVGAVLDAVEVRYPVLQGTIRKAVYLGNVMEYTVDTAAGELFAVSNAVDAPLAPGSAVGVRDPVSGGL